MSEQNKWSKAIEVLETECKTSEVSLRSLCFLFVQVVMDGASVQIINKEDVTIQ
jgi:hypothetical protein